MNEYIRTPKIVFISKNTVTQLEHKDIEFILIKNVDEIDADICISSDLELLEKIKEKVSLIVYYGPKEVDALARAIDIGVEMFLPQNIDEIRFWQAIEKLKSRFLIKRAKEHNIFMLHQYKNAIDSSNIVSKTDINGIITYVNEEFCKISGYSKEELIGKNHNIVRHPDVPKEHFKRFWDRILAKKIWKGTVKNRAKDGSTFYVNTTVIPILGQSGEIAEFVAIRYDVTKSVNLQERLQIKEKELESLNKELERRVLEKTKQLQELNKTLEKRVLKEVRKNREKDRVMFQQARLASLGEMLGNIAHQWRQPLMELGLLLYKMKKICKNEDMKILYDKGIVILEKMSQTIIDFQNFFSPNKQKELFCVTETIEQALSIIEGSLEKAAIEVRMYLQKDIYVYGYKNEFSQVILNILGNAKDALVQKESPRLIEIVAKQSKKETKVEIFDNGGGIEPHIMEKIFEPYFSTKKKKKGTGLGLYMSKMIIEQSMQGTLQAKNEDDGVKFIIKLPRGKEDASMS